MSGQKLTERALEMARRFQLPKGSMKCVPYGNGHINDTFCLTLTTELSECRRFILQRVNRYVFHNPERMMENIERVTAYLREVITCEGGEPDRETLTLVPTIAGTSWTLDDDGELWRMYLFVEDTFTCDLPDTPELFALSGAAFGRFQRRLLGFDASTLYETIPDFHNTPARLRQLTDAVQRDPLGRRAKAEKEIEFCLDREQETKALLSELEAGNIPLRVTHNDTKLNNVLLDVATGRGMCVIDLDTVMPGLSAYDFGDSIRTGASTAKEDELDLDRVGLSMEMFSAYVHGFLSETGANLTRREIELLPLGAKLMTLECGIRFLTDYLNGDKYFHIHREGHNLDRARTQFKLVRSMEAHKAEMESAVKKA